MVKMKNNLDMEKVNNYLREKLKDKEDIIICLYFEVKTKADVSLKDEKLFLRYARTVFEQNGYDVYFTNTKYRFNNEEKIVKSNESIVAIRK